MIISDTMYSCKVSSLIFSFFFLNLMLNIPIFAFSLRFNFSHISPKDISSFNLSGDAYMSSQGIQLTPDAYNKVGWAIYTQPLHLWDVVSMNMASFSTHFSFVMTSNTSYKGEGLAFFMATPGYGIPPNSTGGCLGLTTTRNDSSQSYSPALNFVAVEFDLATYNENWDPKDAFRQHVGIDINSMASVTTTKWNLYSLIKEFETDVWVTYNASSYKLSVGFTVQGLDSNNSDSTKNLSYEVDLREYLPEDVIVGFSAATGLEYYSGLNNIKSWDFASVMGVDAAPLAVPPKAADNGATSIKRNWKGKNNRSAMALGLSVSLPSLALIVLAFAGYFFWKKKAMKDQSGADESLDSYIHDEEFEKGTGPQKFSYRELADATSNFSEKQKLGGGGFGWVYRGFLKGTGYIAVKKVSRDSKQGIKEYESEVKIISQLRHKNLVQLLGWCHEIRGELLLVYSFMPNKSLDYHLFDNNSNNNEQSILPWELRYKIARGLASALLYLHEEWEQCVLHRDIKSSNVMLDSKFDARLGDFGLARIVAHEKGSQTTALAGTLGYMAPEYVITGRASKESDVYSFGVVLLEIASGRRAFDCMDQRNSMKLVQWVWDLYTAGKPLDAADPNLQNEFDAREMENLIVVGLWSVHPDDSRRPSVRQVIRVLNFEAPLPTGLSMKPMSLYYPTAMNMLVGSSTESSGRPKSSFSHSSGVNSLN